MRKTVVEQYTKSGEFVKQYSSIREAADKTEAGYQQICDNLSGKYQSAGGFIWKKKKISPVLGDYDSILEYCKELESRIVFLESKIGSRADISKSILSIRNEEESFKDVAEEVCRWYEITIDNLINKSSKEEFVVRRKMLYYICFEYYKMKPGRIWFLMERIFNFKTDRATVYHNIQGFQIILNRRMISDRKDINLYYKVMLNLNLQPNELND